MVTFFCEYLQIGIFYKINRGLLDDLLNAMPMCSGDVIGIEPAGKAGA